MDATSTNPDAFRIFRGKRLVPASDGCLIYPVKPGARGYALVNTGGRGDNKAYLAHRIAYELAYGPIPEGMTVDHLCHTRLCVNPDHLRVITPAQNQQNRKGANANSQTGYRGVSRRGNKFYARVWAAGAEHWRGGFDTAEEAAEAASEMRRALMPFSEKDKH
ncbi:HNH endonuclease [Mycobacterium phage Squint]|nr:HNH endonuclease [Mycobacterium phage Squint]